MSPKFTHNTEFYRIKDGDGFGNGKPYPIKLYITGKGIQWRVGFIF